MLASITGGGIPLPANVRAGPEVRPLDPVELIGRFVEWYGARYIAKADRRIRRLGVNAAIFSGEDAVNEAAATLLKALIDGRLTGRFLAVEDLREPFESRLRDAISGQHRRECADKRGGNRAHVPISTLGDTSESSQPPHARTPPVDQSLIVEEAIDRLITAHRRHGARLARVVVLRLSGASRREIADDLGLADVASVERLFHRIRAVLGSWLRPPG